MPRIKLHMKAMTMVLFCLFTFSVFALQTPNTDENLGLTPLGLEGYDAVSYFTGDTPVKGDNQYQQIHRGKKYLFSNVDNLNAFSASPDRFLPQLDGLCAHTATDRNLVASDPSIYLIEQGKLYHFSSEEAKSNWTNTIDENNIGLITLALEGFDVTSYFGPMGPVKGNAEYQAVYDDKRYFFASRENQQKFAASPEQFLPQFDGYCAHSVSRGTPLLSQPELYAIDDGKLLLFSSTDAQNAYNKDPIGTISDANKYWELTKSNRKDKIAAKNLWKTEGKVKLFTF